MFGIISKDKMRKRKNSLLTFLGDLFGGSYSAAIALSIYPDIDIERLYLTMKNQLIEASKRSVDYNDISENIICGSEEKEHKHFFESFIKCLIVSIFVGFLYGVSIFLLKVNIIFIPIISYIIIIYVYNKNYKEENFNFIYRILIGLICVLQVFIGVLTAIFLETKLPVNIANIVYVIAGYFRILIKDPLEQGYIIIISLFVFIGGFFQGHKFKFQKLIGKITMKRIGKYYLKREGNIATIYLIDPVQYNGEGVEKLATTIYDDCLIEVSKRTIKAFYIPKAFIDQLEVNITYRLYPRQMK
jgi:hypothetical protein